MSKSSITTEKKLRPIHPGRILLQDLKDETASIILHVRFGVSRPEPNQICNITASGRFLAPPCCIYPAWRWISPRKTAIRRPAHRRGAGKFRELPRRAERVIARQKDEANSIAWNTADESLRVLDHAPDAPVETGDINGPLRRQDVKFFRREPAVAGDVGQHLFRRLSGKASHGSADHGPKGKNVFMDGHQVDDVAGFAPVGSGCRFVCRQVDGVKHITEQIVPLRGEESKRAVGDPFKLHGLAETIHLGLPLAGLSLTPGQFQPGLSQGPAIGFGGCRKAIFRVLENIDITGKRRPFPIDSRREHAQHVGLQLSEHGTVFRCVPPSAGRPCRREFSVP